MVCLDESKCRDAIEVMSNYSELFFIRDRIVLGEMYDLIKTVANTDKYVFFFFFFFLVPYKFSNEVEGIRVLGRWLK